MEKGQSTHTSDEEATALTQWTARELLPSIPRSLDARIQGRLASLTPQLVLGQVLTHAVRAADHARVNRALIELAAGLGVDIQEYDRITTWIIDALGNDRTTESGC